MTEIYQAVDTEALAERQRRLQADLIDAYDEELELEVDDRRQDGVTGGVPQRDRAAEAVRVAGRRVLAHVGDEVHAGDELHGEIPAGAVREELVERDEVRVRRVRERAKLLL